MCRLALPLLTLLACAARPPPVGGPGGGRPPTPDNDAGESVTRSDDRDLVDLPDRFVEIKVPDGGPPKQPNADPHHEGNGVIVPPQ